MTGQGGHCRSEPSYQTSPRSLFLSLSLSLALSFILSFFLWLKKKEILQQRNPKRRDERPQRNCQSRSIVRISILGIFFSPSLFFELSSFRCRVLLSSMDVNFPLLPPPRSLTAIRHLSAAAAPPHPIQFLSLRRLIDCGRCSR